MKYIHTPHYKNVPNGWIIGKVGEVANYINGRAFKPVEWEPEGLPIIRIQNLNDPHAQFNFSTKEYENKYLINHGNLLFAWAASLGTYIWDGNKAWLNQHIFKVEPKEYMDKMFLHYSFQNLIADFYRQSHGSGMVHITKNKFENTPILIPPINEQRRIVAEIEKWFALIDELEANKQDLQQAIKQIKSKILDLAIHGKLVPQDPNDEPAIDLLRRINPNFTPCDTSHYQNLPRNWSICMLEDIVDYEQPTQYIVETTNYSHEYGTPVLTAGKSFILGYTNEINGIYNNLPTIIFDDFTTDSRLVDFPFKVKSSAMKILQVHKEININYVAYFMSITRLIGDTHKRYWISEYSKIPIPIPPKQEQDRIVAAIQDINNVIQTISTEL